MLATPVSPVTVSSAKTKMNVQVKTITAPSLPLAATVLVVSNAHANPASLVTVLFATMLTSAQQVPTLAVKMQHAPILSASTLVPVTVDTTAMVRTVLMSTNAPLDPTLVLPTPLAPIQTVVSLVLATAATPVMVMPVSILTNALLANTIATAMRPAQMLSVHLTANATPDMPVTV